MSESGSKEGAMSQASSKEDQLSSKEGVRKSAVAGSVSFAEGTLDVASGLRASVEMTGSMGEHQSSELILASWHVPLDEICRSCVCKITPAHEGEFGNGLLVKCHHRPYVLTSNKVIKSFHDAEGTKVILGPEPHHADPKKRSSMTDKIGDGLANFGHSLMAGARNSISGSVIGSKEGSKELTPAKDGSKEGEVEIVPETAEQLKVEHPPFPELLLQPDIFFETDAELGFSLIGVHFNDVKGRKLVDMASHGDHPHPVVNSKLIAFEREKHGGHAADLFEAIVGETHEYGRGTSHHHTKIVVSSEYDNRLPGTAFFQKNAEGHGSHLVALRHDATKSIDRSSCTLVKSIVRTVEAHLIIATMRVHVENSSAQERECRSLRHLTAHDHESKRYVAARGGYAQLAIAIEQHADINEVVEQATAVIRNLAAESHVRVGLVEANASELLCKIVMDHEDHPTVQEHGLGALCNLACSDEGRVQVFAAGALDLVRLMIANHMEQAGKSESVRLLEQCCGAFWNLSTNNIEAQSDIQEHGGTKTLCEILEKHSASPGLIAAACGALGNVVAGNPSNREAAATDEAVKHICDALMTHPHHAETQRQACAALWSLTANSELNQADAVDQGALKLVMAAIDAHSGSHQVLENAFGALRNLTVQKKENKTAIANLGAVVRICDGMAAHLQSAGVQRQGCGLLWNLAAGPIDLQLNLVEKGAFDHLCKAAEAHPTVVAVSENACGAIRNLATSSDKVKAATWTFERVVQFCGLLRFSHSNVVLQRQGFEILQIFCAAGAGFCEDMVKAGGVECVISGMEANLGHEIVQERACHALTTLLWLCHAAVTHFIKCDGLVAVCSTLDAHSHNLPVLHQALNVLEAAAGKEGLKWHPLEKAGAISKVVEVMDDHPTHPSIQEGGLRVLQCLCKGRAGGRKAVVEAAGINRILKIMVAHSGSPLVQEHGCGMIANVCDGDDNELRKMVADCKGCIKHILASMATHSKEEKVISEAVRAFFAVCLGGLRIQVLILNLGVVESVLGSMKAHKDSLAVQTHCVELFLALSECNEGRVRMIRHEALKQVNTAMSDHVADLHLQRLAMKVFEWYVSEDEHRLIVGKTGVIGSIAQGMKKHEDDHLLQRDACRLIDNVVQGLPENQDKAGQTKDLMDRIAKAFVTHDTDVKIFACEALAALAAANQKNKQAIVKSGCLPEVCKAMAKKPGSKEDRKASKESANSQAMDDLLEAKLAAAKDPSAEPEASGETRKSESVPTGETRKSGKPEALGEMTPGGTAMQAPMTPGGTPMQVPTTPGGTQVPTTPGGTVINVFEDEEDQEPALSPRSATALALYQDLVVQSMTLFWALSANSKSRIAVSATNAVSLVCQAMRDFPKHVAINERACAALASFSKNDRKGQNTVVKNDGLKLVCDAMKYHIEAEHVQRYGAAALWSLANNNLDFKLTILGLGAVTLISEAMSAHPDSSMVQAQCCGALWQLAASGDDARSSIVDLGKYMDQGELVGDSTILILLGKAMSSHKEDASLARHSCETLRSLACGGLRIQKEIVHLDLLERICGCMVTHLGHPGLQLQGIAALTNVTFKNNHFKDQLRLAGGLDLILTAMDTHIESSSVQEFGCWALANMAANHAPSAQAISNAYAKNQITNAMDAFTGNPNVQSMGYAAERRLEHFPPTQPEKRHQKDGARKSSSAPSGPGRGGGGPGIVIEMTAEMMADFENDENSSEGTISDLLDEDELEAHHKKRASIGLEETKKRRCVLM